MSQAVAVDPDAVMGLARELREHTSVLGDRAGQASWCVGLELPAGSGDVAGLVTELALAEGHLSLVGCEQLGLAAQRLRGVVGSVRAADRFGW